LERVLKFKREIMSKMFVTNGIVAGAAKSVSQFVAESKSDRLTKEQEFELIAQAQAGDTRARTKVIQSQLRFVMQIARKYQGNGLSLEDLIQSGNIGLCEAVDAFDVSKGFRFNTFAQWKVRGEITAALQNEGRTVRIPHSQTDRSQTVKSISDPVGDSDNAETYADRYLKGDAAVDVFAQSDLTRDLQSALNSIKPRQAEAICRFFGIGYEYAQPMEQIGAEMNIGAEGARLLVRGAEKALKQVAGIELLSDYID
jgi:RNA polymerase sigma factor (sigma-70 family)